MGAMTIVTWRGLEDPENGPESDPYPKKNGLDLEPSRVFK